MIRSILPLLLLSLLLCNISYGSDAEIDTTKREVGPGMTHIVIIDDDKPQRNHILKFDISKEENRIESQIANDKVGAGFETTVSMSQRNEADGNVVIGALNADFFGIQAPSNPFGFLSANHIEDGSYIIGKQPGRPQFGVENGTLPFIDYIDLEGVVIKPDIDLQMPVYGVNSQPDDSNVILFTEHISSLPSFEEGVQVVLTPAGDGVHFNSWAEATVDQIVEEEDGLSVSENQLILATRNDDYGSELTELSEGDQVEIRTGNETAVSGDVAAGNGEFSISGYNTSRGENDLILYDSDFGFSTQTNEFGAEAILTPVNENNGIYEVDELEDGVGNITIPEEGYVLSGHGDAAEFLTDNLEQGSEVTLDLAFEADYDFITALVGGNHVLVENGENQFEGASPGSERPRSAVCIDEDETTVYFVAADGDQVFSSVGKDIPQLAAFMTDLGCHHALNVDGGGSTTLAIRNEMANHHAGGSQRAVGNSLLAVADINYDDIADYLEFGEEQAEMYYEDTLAVDLSVMDEWDFELPIPMDDIDFTVEGFQGYVEDGFLITEDDSEGQGWLIAEYLDFSDSMQVDIREPVSAYDEEPDEIVTEHKLKDNYPNPFNPNTIIEFHLPEREEITLTVYDVNGRAVRTLENGVFDAGIHEVEFNATGLASGTYIYELRGDETVLQKQMMFIK